MIPFVGQVQEVVVHGILVVPHGPAAVVAGGEEPLFALVCIHIQHHMDAAGLGAFLEGGLGIGAGQVGEQPDGPFQVVPGKVFFLFQEVGFPFQGSLVDAGVIVDGKAIQGSHGNGVFHNTVIDFLYRQIGVSHQILFAPEVPGQNVGSLLEVFEGKQLAFFVRQQGLEFRFRDHILPGDLEAVHLDFQGIREIQFGPFRFFHRDLPGGRRSPLGFCPGPVPGFVLQHGGITLPLTDIPQGRSFFPAGCCPGHRRRQDPQAQGNGRPDHRIPMFSHHPYSPQFYCKLFCNE